MWGKTNREESEQYHWNSRKPFIKRFNLGVGVAQDSSIKNFTFSKFESRQAQTLPKNKLFQSHYSGIFQRKPISKKVFQWLPPTYRQIWPHNFKEISQNFKDKEAEFFKGVILTCSKGERETLKLTSMDL